MSYGMFSDIMRIIGDNEDTLELLMNEPNIRDQVIRRLFTPTKKPIQSIDDLINPFDIEASPMEMDVIIAWVVDHAMHFTMSTAEKARPVVEKHLAAAVSSNQSRNGSEA